MIESGAEGVDIAAWIGSLILNLLERCIVTRVSEERLGGSYGRLRSLRFRQSEIQQGNLARGT